MTQRPPAKSARIAKVDALAIAIDAAIEAANQQELEALDKRCAAMLKASSEEEARLWYYRSNVQAALQNTTDAKAGNGGSRIASARFCISGAQRRLQGSRLLDRSAAPRS